MVKPARTNGMRTKGETTKAKLSKGQASDRRKKRARGKLTANELMLEAWKKLYETRRKRLL